MKKALIVGGTGFVGVRLIRALAAQKVFCRVVVHRRPVEKLSDVEPTLIEFVGADILDPGSLEGLAQGIDTVYNLAAVGHVSALSEEAHRTFHRVNVEGVANLGRACGHYSLTRFVHLSSTAAVGMVEVPLIDEAVEPNPQTPYQRSKWQGEKVLWQIRAETGLPVVILRPCMIYGPGESGEFPKFCRLISKGLFPRAGLKPVLVPLVHVDDVVTAAILAGERGLPGETYFIASKVSPKMTDIHRLVTRALGIRRLYWYAPVRLLLLVAFLAELHATWRVRVPVVTRANVRSTAASRVFSIAKAQRDLGYEPQVSFDKGIPEAVDWYRQQGLL